MEKKVKAAMTKPASNLVPLIGALPHVLMETKAAVMLCL